MPNINDLAANIKFFIDRFGVEKAKEMVIATIECTDKPKKLKDQSKIEALEILDQINERL